MPSVGGMAEGAGLELLGWSVVTPRGIGRAWYQNDIVVHGSDDGQSTPQDSAGPTQVATGRVKEFLGRRGGSSLNRSAVLLIRAIQGALEEIDAAASGDGDSTGLVVGTTAGSVESISEFYRDTIVNERPYFVDPLRFPNTVMNSAAGEAAIWFGYRGPNATLAGGPLAAIQAIQHAMRLTRRERARTVVVGGAEECSVFDRALGSARATPAGGVAIEGSAAFVTRAAPECAKDAPKPQGRVLAVRTATALGDDARSLASALDDVIRLAVDDVGLGMEDVWLVASGCDGTGADHAEAAGLSALLNSGRPRHLMPKRAIGDVRSVSGFMQIAAVLAAYEAFHERRSRAAMVTSVDPNGVVGALVMRGE